MAGNDGFVASCSPLLPCLPKSSAKVIGIYWRIDNGSRSADFHVVIRRRRGISSHHPHLAAAQKLPTFGRVRFAQAIQRCQPGRPGSGKHPDLSQPVGKATRGRTDSPLRASGVGRNRSVLGSAPLAWGGTDAPAGPVPPHQGGHDEIRFNPQPSRAAGARSAGPRQARRGDVYRWQSEC